MKSKSILIYLFFLSIAALSFLVLINLLLPRFIWVNEPVHSTVEAFGSLAAIFMAIMLFHRQHEEGGWRLFWMATGLLSMGLLGGFHSVARLGHGFVFLYSVACFSGGFWFALAWLPESGRFPHIRKWIPWIVAAGSVLLGVWTLLFRETMPLMVEDGKFTLAAILTNLLAGVFFLAATGRFLLDFHRSGKKESFLFSCMALLFGLANLSFPFSAVWDNIWWTWHLLRVSAFLPALWFVFKSDRQTISTLRSTIVEREQIEESLRKIEWLMTKSIAPESVRDEHVQLYGDLTEINSSRVILDYVGKEVLEDIVSDYLDLLDTSGAIYEKNGDYALGIFSSNWCRFLDTASRNLCGTEDNRKALESGKWLCHESCWTGASKASIETGKPVDTECNGGIRLYAIPIRVQGEIMGSINFGYGDPPKDPGKLQEIAERYKIRVEDLLKYANPYESRPPFIIDLAKKRLLTSARLIGLIIEQKQAAEALRRTEENFRHSLDDSPLGVRIVTMEGETIYANRAILDIYGYDSIEELKTTPVAKRYTPESYAEFRIRREKRRQGVDDPSEYGIDIIRKNSEVRHLQVFRKGVLWDGEIQYQVIYEDITERKQAADRELLAREVLNLLNRPEDETGAIRNILLMVKKSQGFEAAGIRLKEGDDFPYFQTDGFPDHFVKAERYLCVHNGEGKIVRDGQGNPVLECMCGNVICGRTDAALPFFTENGSFWTNSTTDLLASTTEEDRLACTRNRCNAEGYESVALIPLRSGDEVIGLLQINDHRRNRFTLEMIRFFEGLGSSIGIALSRNRAVEELRETRDYLESLFNYANAPIIVWNPGFRITRFNRAFERLTGFAAGEVIGRELQMLFPEGSREESLSLIARTLSGEYWESVEIPILRKDGNTRLALWNSANLYTTDGATLIATIAQGQDITERKQAERDRRHRIRELDVLYKISRSTAQSLNLHETLNNAVDATLQALQVEAGGIYLLEPAGKTMTLRVHRGASEEFVEAVRHIQLGEGVSGRAAAEGKPVVLDVADYPSERMAPHVVKEGIQTLASTPLFSAGKLLGALNLVTRQPRPFPPEEIRLLEAIGQVLGQAVRNVQLYESVQQELAERKRTVEKLRETRDYLENLFGYANAPIIVWDPEFKIARFNHAFEHLTGYMAEEVIGKNLQILFPDSSREESLVQIKSTLSGAYWESVEIPILCKDGGIQTALWNSANIYAADDSTLVATIAQGQDITERKQQTTELIRSNREKALLLKEIHHRVKNNLQIIASLLRLNTKYSGDERVEEIFRESQDRIRSMAAVHSMLYKSENFAEINFGEYVRETARQLFRSYNTNPEAVSLLINADDVMIPIDTAIPCGLIINELVSNALKHAFPDGRRGEIRIEMNQDENGVRIIFEDNGAGFPEGMDFSNTETLGLQLVNMLVAQLDGAIEMVGNGGTRYVITLKT